MAKRDRRSTDFGVLSPEQQQRVLEACHAMGVDISPIEDGHCENCDAHGQRWTYSFAGQWPFAYCGLCIGERVAFPTDPVRGGLHHANETATAHTVKIEMNKVLQARLDSIGKAAMDPDAGKTIDQAARRDIPQGPTDGIIPNFAVADLSGPQEERRHGCRQTTPRRGSGLTDLKPSGQSNSGCSASTARSKSEP